MCIDRHAGMDFHGLSSPHSGPRPGNAGDNRQHPNARTAASSCQYATGKFVLKCRMGIFAVHLSVVCSISMTPFARGGRVRSENRICWC